MGFKAPILLAARLRQVERIILGPDNDFAPFLEGGIRHIEGKRCAAALMLSRVDAVDPYGRAVIDGPEMQQPPIAVVSDRQLDAAPIPADAEKTRVADATGRGFRCKRYGDLLRPAD